MGSLFCHRDWPGLASSHDGGAAAAATELGGSMAWSGTPSGPKLTILSEGLGGMWCGHGALHRASRLTLLLPSRLKLGLRAQDPPSG